MLNFSNQAQEIDSELLSDNYIIKDENSTSNLLASNGYFISKQKIKIVQNFILMILKKYLFLLFLQILFSLMNHGKCMMNQN